MFDTPHILSTIILVINFGIALPLLTHILYAFTYRYQNEPWVRKRHAALLRVTHTMETIYNCILTPLTILLNPLWKHTPDVISYSTCYFIHTVYTFLFGNVHIARIWLLYVKIRRVQDGKKWRKSIDPSFSTWILRYYYILSNAGLVTIIVIVSTVTQLSISYFAIQTASLRNYALVCVSIMCIWPLTVGTFLLVLGRGFTDLWSIRFELRIYIISVVIGAATFGCVVYFAGLSSESVLVSAWILGVTILHVFWTTMGGCVVPWLNETRYRMLDSAGIRLSSSSTSNNQYTNLLRCVSTMEGYETLQKHMEKEFNSESLLFFTELMQLQRWIVRNNDGLLDRADLFLESRFSLPSRIPLSPCLKYWLPQRGSTISYNKSSHSPHIRPTAFSHSPNDNLLDSTTVEVADSHPLGHIFTLLFKKYFERNKAPFECNVSSNTYHKLLLCYQRLTESDIPHPKQDMFPMDIAVVWEALCEGGREVLPLIADSFARFCYRETVWRSTQVEPY